MISRLVFLAFTLPSTGQIPVAADREFFEQKVRPLLVEHCYACHSAESKKAKGGLRVDSRESLLQGGDSGPAIVPSDAKKSLLFQAVQYGSNDTLQMPPKGKLPARDIAILGEWINRGATFPASQKTVDKKDGIDLAQGRKFWSFQPLSKRERPKIKQTDWPRTRIDHFLLAEQEKRGLKPSAPATPAQLLRRVHFDLVGLPPTPAEFESFALADYEKVVDRLLASPQHGERWGRYWLDLARYCDISEPWAETKGHSYLYRDWVVRALNADVPFDQFIRLQLAADQMNAPRADHAALGFVGLSPSYWKELQLPPEIIKTVVAEEWEERIHTLTSTFLGLNVACARCHDHKFDPITAQDYYALAGIFASTRPADISPLEEAATKVVLKARDQVKNLEAEVKKLQAKKPPEDPVKIAAMQKQIAALKSETPHYDVPFAIGIQDASLFVVPDGAHKTKLDYKINQPQNLPVHIRGNPNNPGPVTPRRFLSVLSSPDSKPFEKGSGRLELANAIVRDGQALTARVIVNRIWKHHFGVGLVETPSDFGTQGEKPSHPDLLDDLAFRFVENGWSLRWLHREIVLSAAYRQASGPASSVDPDNRFLARMSRKRLDVEAWRDAMLAVTGKLDATVGGPAVELNDPKNVRRTLYGVVKRRELNDLLRLHDFPDPITHSPNRVPTTTPLQQLFTLNSPLMQRQAAALVERLRKDEPGDDANRVRRAFQLLFGRMPSTGQVETALAFLKDAGPAGWTQYAQVLLGSNEFLFVD